MQDPPKDRIKRTAMRLFVEHGVDAVSMRDIAEAAGMKAPSLYAHFRSREELISEMFQASYAEYGHRLAQAAASRAGFRDQLDAMVRTICALHAEDELLFNFLLLTQHGFLREIAPSDNTPVEVICSTVEAGMRRGEIAAGDSTVLAGAIIGTVVQLATFRLYGRLPMNLAAYAGQIAAICQRIVP